MSINILDEMKNDFLVYAQEVNNNRSFPDARDGLKPGMRAALWEMYSKGYSSAKPHVKSAKVTGGTIATWWPHGDSSVYEAVVRMSQPWVNNICEIDFHGANGSLLGGPDAASSRYTECRLAKAIEEGFFSNIKKDTVDMILNFSEDERWPSVFPAIFPRLFVNGSQGIGYTIAQEWEPGNLIEFSNKVKTYISDNVVDCSDIYPDYPTGGLIINRSEVKKIYETGRGQVILRGKTEIVGDFIKITELPYQVYAEPLIQKIKDLVNAGTLSGVEDICNKSDDSGLLIEIECSEKPDVVLSKLFKLTDLQMSFNANQMALINGIPQMLTLKDYIKVYVDHNILCLKREYQFDLDKALVRKEIVDGLINAISIIDKVIVTIKSSTSSEDAKINLSVGYGFTMNQAKAIVEMRLGKLANLEIVELEKEQAELVKLIDKCNKFLASDKLQKKEFLSRLDNFVSNFGYARHTEVVDIDLDAEKSKLKKHEETTAEDYMICLTKGNFIKRISMSDYKPQRKVLTATDEIVSAIQVGLKDRFVLISAKGTMYKMQANKIDLCNMNSAGMSLKTRDHDKIVAVYSGNETLPYLFMITKNGLAKKIDARTVFDLCKLCGAPIMKVEDKDEIIYCTLADDDTVIPYSIGTKEKELRVEDFLPKGRTAGGVVAIKLSRTLKTFEIKKRLRLISKSFFYYLFFNSSSSFLSFFTSSNSK